MTDTQFYCLMAPVVFAGAATMLLGLLFVGW
jgi:hypothetical protein